MSYQMLSPVDFISTSLSPLENYIEIFSDTNSSDTPTNFTLNTETNLYGFENNIKNKKIDFSSFTKPWISVLIYIKFSFTAEVPKLSNHQLAEL